MRKSGFLAAPASYMSQSLCEIGEDGGSKAIITAKIGHKRPKPKIIYRKTDSSDEEENEQFHANPAEDIPHNKLVDKLVRGLQSYI